jgi:hypothetical protein
MSFATTNTSNEWSDDSVDPSELAAARDVMISLVTLTSFTKRTLKQSGLNNCHEEIHQECCLQIIKQIRKGNIIFSFCEDKTLDINNYQEIKFFIIKKDGSKEQIKHLRSYLQTICRHIISKLRTEFYRLQIDHSYNIEEYSNSINQDYDHNLQDAIQSRLNLAERRIIELFYFKGLQDEEIRRHLYHESIGNYRTVNIRKIRSRAVEKLSKFFSKN